MGEQRDPPGGRLLKRIGVMVVRHARAASLLFCIAGIIALIILPLLAKPVYVDENALMPGSAQATFAQKDAVTAYELAKELQELISSDDHRREFYAWFARHMDAMGADYYFHPFCPPPDSLSIYGFLTSPHTYEVTSSCKVPGVNAVGIIRAPQGEGNEAIVVITPLDLERLTSENAVTVGLSLALMQLLSKSLWLAKDIIWVATDSRHGKYTAAASWLKEYHEPSMEYTALRKETLNTKNLSLHQNQAVDVFKRAGSITAGFVIELSPSSERRFNVLKIQTEGPNGQMPNMDMISIINLLVSWRHNFHLRRDGMKTWPWIKYIADVVELISKTVAWVRKSLLSHSASYMTAEEYVNGISILAKSCWSQMLGVPTGSHGAFREFQVDAITLEVTTSNALNLDFIMNFGRLIEGALRSVNNLLEKFHASVFLYLMVSPNKFISISTYIIPFALLLVNFPIQAAALSSQSKSSWIEAAFLVLTIEAWSIITASLPLFLNNLFASIPIRLTVWFVLSLVSLSFLLVLFPWKSPQFFSESSYIPLKALTLALTGIALGILSAVNFSVALLGTLLLLPMCLSAYPLRILFNKPGFSRFSAIILPLITCIPFLLVLSNIFPLSDPDKLWTIIETLWFYGSALYVSLFLVWLPCSILCAYIMFL